MEKNIVIDLLTEKSVSILTIYTVEIEGEVVEVKKGRKAYDNSPLSRQLLIDEVGEPYISAIFTIWGDTPIVEDPEEPEIKQATVKPVTEQESKESETTQDSEQAETEQKSNESEATQDSEQAETV